MRIIQRKKYYYLQHSFRRGKKVTTKEKYLGKTIPKNIEEIKKEFFEECNKINLFVLFKRIKKGFQKEWQKYPQSMKEKVKKQIAIAFTYNSNAIEGSTITLDEARELVEHQIAPNKPLKDIKETENHVKVFLKILRKREMFNQKLILKLHKDIFLNTKPDMAGKLRDYIVKVGDYRAPDWQEVPDLMKELIKFYQKNKNMNPVELAARLHYKFEKIHPFGDGNGRVGRIIMNFILWSKNYPMIIIEYKKRKSYYNALKKDENKFFNYFARRYLSIHKKYLK